MGESKFETALEDNKRELYVCGLVYGPDNTVVLIKKNRPDWQKGYLNGVGGKVEVNETPLDAMVREFNEECGVVIKEWKHFLTFEIGNATVYWFTFHFLENYLPVRSLTDEVADYHSLNDYERTDKCVRDLGWILPMGLNSVNFDSTIHVKQRIERVGENLHINSSIRRIGTVQDDVLNVRER